MNLSLSLKSPKINKPVTFTVQIALLIVAVAFIVVPGKSRSREWRNGTAFRPYIVAAPNVPAPPQGSGYAYRRTITTDHTKVPNTDQSNFPLLISGTYSYLATVSNGGNVQNANGYDVIFTSDAGCANRLDHEVETYSATTGGVNYWVRLPSLSHTNDTTIYMCYGNSAFTTDQSNKTGVWDNNFKALYHLKVQVKNLIHLKVLPVNLILYYLLYLNHQ